MTEAMPETGACFGDDWTRDNHLDNQRVASGVKGSLEYLYKVHSDHNILEKSSDQIVSKQPCKNFEVQCACQHLASCECLLCSCWSRECLKTLPIATEGACRRENVWTHASRSCSPPVSRLKPLFEMVYQWTVCVWNKNSRRKPQRKGKYYPSHS